MKQTWLSFIFAGLLLSIVSFNNSADYLWTPKISPLKEINTEVATLPVSKLSNHLTAEIINLTSSSQIIKNFPLAETKLTVTESTDTKTPILLLEAASAAIYDLTDNKLVYSKSPDLPRPLASLTKIMTAIVSSEQLGYDHFVYISDSAITTEEVAGWFTPGEIFSVRDLLTSLFLVSSNDAAVALAEQLELPKFIENMNNKAAFLDMDNTVFLDPAGLNPNTHGTVSDLINLAKYLYSEKPELVNISRQTEANITDRLFGHFKSYANIHPLASESFFRGGKTGYLAEAQGNLITFWQAYDHTFLFVVLGAPDREVATRNLIDWLNNNYNFYYGN